MYRQLLFPVASKFLSSCVFSVPKGTAPSKFSPDMANVYVDGQLVPKNDTTGWSWAAGTDSVEIHGTLCSNLLAGKSGKVEILLGCSTVIN